MTTSETNYVCDMCGHVLTAEETHCPRDPNASISSLRDAPRPITASEMAELGNNRFNKPAPLFFRDLAIGDKFRFVGLDTNHPCAGTLATKVSALLFTCYVKPDEVKMFSGRRQVIREDAHGVFIRLQARAGIQVVRA